MLIYQRSTFADDFLLQVLLPHLPTRATRLLGVLGIWRQPIRSPGSRPSIGRSRTALRQQLAHPARRSPPAA